MRPETAPRRPAPALVEPGPAPPRLYPRAGAAVARRHPVAAFLSALPALAIAALVAALVAAGVGLAFGFRYEDLAEVPLPQSPEQSPEPSDSDTRAATARLERRIAAQWPAGVFLQVDTVANRLYLRRGGKVLREAVCSTGTGGLLEDPASGRRWVFETPRGVHRVLAKKQDPVWNKPDWAFVEEGLPLPKDDRERLDPYSLGDYALYLGHGYLIHGTLYQRLLGRSVTHGCIRLGDEDLEAVFRATPVGARVYIY